MQEINLNDIDFGSFVSAVQNKQKTYISSGSSNNLKNCCTIFFLNVNNLNHS